MSIPSFPLNNYFFKMYRVRRIHFVGIGGSGMCGLAKILACEGYYITGSDIVCNNSINRLLELGIKFFLGHHCDNINNANVIVVSSAINSDNPEILAARRACIPIIRRSEMLSELMRLKHGIAVAGTHGKTTTTAMIINIYIKAGLDPTFINGGVLKSEGVEARLGTSNYLIAEADESDKSFLCLNPIVSVVTNIDFDHMSTYKGNFEYLKQSFVQFIHNLPFYGYSVVCIDDLVIREIMLNINRRIVTYGFSEDADFRIADYHQCVEKSQFIILYGNKKQLKITLNTPGYHNALNATAAAAVAIKSKINDQDILDAMLNFQGTCRRFENLGDCALDKINGLSGKIMLIDDYGHHPTELRATISTVRIGWPKRRLVMIFQPHRFTRMQELYNEFVHVLSKVDVLLILDVYSAGEHPIFGYDSQSLCCSIRKYGKINPIFISNIYILLETLKTILVGEDLLLIQGAGTIGEVVRGLII